MSSLLVDWCSYKAAKYAVEHWHYSKVMPVGKLVKLGIWERRNFIGTIIFSRGAAMNIGKPYNLQQTEVCELTRIAMAKHKVPVTQCLSIAISMLKQSNSGLRLIVSYADSAQGHLGKIYQASNWIYVGSSSMKNQIVNGKQYHPRTIYSRYGRQDIEFLKKYIDPNACWIETPEKYKYLYPLDKGMRRKIIKLAQPYPQAEEVSKVIHSTSS